MCMVTIRVLILEDDLEAVSYLLKKLSKLEDKIRRNIAVTVLSEYTQVEVYINKNPKIFDIVLLDRDCKAGGSFHVLDFNKYHPDHIIGISSTPPYNEQLRQKGVKRIVQKDFSDLEKFSEETIKNVEDLITTFNHT